MGKRNRRKPIFLENIEIIDTASKGKSLAKHEGRVIFVEEGVPGDICDIVVFKRRKKFWEARIEKIHTYSERRTDPQCEHFGTCGGCKWQNMGYEHQLAFKENEVINNLKRIGKVELPEITPILGSEDIYFYRNKMEFSFSNNRWLSLEEIKDNATIENRNALGFHIPSMWDKILDIDKCWLQADPSNAIRNELKTFANAQNIPFFDPKQQSGVLRTLMIRTSSTGEIWS